ncbi:hypothetical protein C0Q70_04581 [Pomacea canaliculata]|uniref:EGF-like domain-containing protein n=1 Tax=Pomacea canaliculata TaxID=400727 RepID=A0A2T7PIU8_POMCA|nr:hypothetical protein C0Q70_04581 [Pomacea canaliculata]
MVAMQSYLHLTRPALVIVSFSVCLTSAVQVQCGNGTFMDDNLCRPCGFCLGETDGTTEACDPSTGACAHGCVQGYTEPLCLNKCGACIGGNDQCANGVCTVGCEQGFTGPSCNIPCTAGTFGENCEQACGHCEGGNTTCDTIVGACKEGCEDGWSGLFCNIQCPNGRWGPNCDKKCGNCDRMDNCNKATEKEYKEEKVHQLSDKGSGSQATLQVTGDRVWRLYSCLESQRR